MNQRISSSVLSRATARPAPRVETEAAPRLTDFSDRLRVVAMVGVVGIHCTLPTLPQDSSIWFDQVGKFVDGLFLFVSGYLWQLRGGSSRPLHYLGDRLRALALPYLLWTVLTGVVIAGLYVASPDKAFALATTVRIVLTATALWFIPQLLLSLVVTSWLWRTVGPIASGVVLSSISLAYGLNLHAGWHPIHHTEAPLGFAFFVWLGFVVRTHEQEVRRRLFRVPPAMWTVALLFTYTASAVEGLLLGTGDSLRLANLGYTSVAIGAALAYCYRRNVRFREPASTRGRVYGIYLVHTCVVIVVVAGISWALPDHWQDTETLSWYVNVVGRLALFAVVWPLSSFIVTSFQRRGLARLVGAPPRRPARS